MFGPMATEGEVALGRGQAVRRVAALKVDPKTAEAKYMSPK